jgi:hypothetical protein
VLRAINASPAAHHAGIAGEHHGEQADLADAAANQLCVLAAVVQDEHHIHVGVQVSSRLLFLGSRRAVRGAVLRGAHAAVKLAELVCVRAAQRGTQEERRRG